MNNMSFDQKATKAKLVRDLWRTFQGSLVSQRESMERKCHDISRAQDAKWRATPTRTQVKRAEHDAQTQAMIRAVREDYYQTARAKWQDALERRGLEDKDWDIITPQEARAIENVLQDQDDEFPATVVQNVFTQPQFFNAPVPIPAPPLSSTARSANTSTSSYTFVSPADFTTDDELYEAVASSDFPRNDSDDERGLPYPGGWGLNGVGPRAVPSSHSSQTGSPDQPPSDTPDYFTYVAAQKRPQPPSEPPKRPPDINSKPNKTRLRGPSYVGPRLSDSDESEEEAADFERFKMQVRVQKIYEFHFTAAQADVELAMTIYNDRTPGKADNKIKEHEKEMLKLQAAKKANDMIKEHEKEMLKLQAAKEEERKSIVAAERRKRRNEFKKRSTLHEPARAANTPTGATANETSPRWDELFDAQQLRVDVNPNKTLSLHKEEEPKPDTQPADQIWEVSPFQSASSRVPAPSGPVKALRERKQSLGRATPSGWKTKQVPSVAPAQSSQQPELSPPAAESEAVPPWLSEALNGLANPIDQYPSFDGDNFGFPGGFPAEAMSTPVSPVANGWEKAPPLNAESAMFTKPTQAEAPITSASAWGIKVNTNKVSPSLPVEMEAQPSVVESKPEKPTPSPALSAANKKLNKKQQQRLAAQKKGSVANSSMIEDEVPASPDTPTVAPKIVSPKDILFQQALAHSHEDVASTPRPELFTAHMKQQGGLMTDYPSDAASTPRASARRLENPFGTSMGAGPSSLGMRDKERQEKESLWAKSLKQMGHGKAKSIGGAVEESQGTVWEQAMKAKLQGQVQAQADVQQRNVLGKNAAIFGMADVGDDEHAWSQTIKAKTPAGGYPLRAMQGVVPPPPAVPEETPWQRMQRLKAEAEARAGAGAGASGNAASKSSMEQPTMPKMAAPSAKHWVDLDRPVSKFVQQAHAVPDNLYWTPNGGVSVGSKHPQMWKPNVHVQPRATSPPSMKQATTISSTSHAANPFETYRMRRMSDPVSPSPRGFGSELPAGSHPAAPTNIQKGSTTTKSSGRKVTIEEVPDEDGPSGRKRPEERLPSNSRIILDIVEPKPSVPRTVFTNIFQYGEEYEEDEYEAGFSSSVPTPSTAPTSPPNEVPSLDEDWFMSAAEEMKNGNWDTLLGGAGPLSRNVPSNFKAKQQQEQSPWVTGSHAKESPPNAQAIDSAKLVSALHSVTKSSSPAAVSQPSPSKPAASVVPPSAPVVLESKEPAAKPNNQTKGKGKGKGKGRR